MLISCKKDKPHVPGGFKEPEGCYNIKDPGTITLDTLQFLSPAFNPNDNNEFVYVKRLLTKGTEKLYTYNISTGKNTILYAGNIGLEREPDWSVNNEIIFGSGLYTINSDGSNLKRLGNLTGGHPKWNKTGDKIIYSWGLSGYDGFIIDKNGVFLDTMLFYKNLTGDNCYYWNSWYNDSLVATVSGNDSNWGIGYRNIYTNNCIQLTGGKKDTRYFIGATAWHPNGKEIYFVRTAKGLYKVNIETGKETFIKECCHRVNYASISFSGDGKEMIMQCEETRLTEFDGAVRTNSIRIMNADGSNERTIEIPK